MSWDISFVHGAAPPPKVADMPGDWRPTPGGTLADLRAALTVECPGLDWSDPHWGIFRGDGFTMEFNLGKDDPVDSFTVCVRGGGAAAVASLERLLALSGWYGLDHTAGEWAHHGADLRASWEGFQAFHATSMKKPEAGDAPRFGLRGLLWSLFRR